MMDTYIRGWEKRHIGCDGHVRFVENLCQPPVEQSVRHAGWLFECVDCGEMLVEEQVEFCKVR